MRLTLLAESFNVTNRVNRRVDISDDGFLNSAGQFVAYSTQVGEKLYPGEFIKNSYSLIPKNSYAPQWVQFSASKFLTGLRLEIDTFVQCNAA